MTFKFRFESLNIYNSNKSFKNIVLCNVFNSNTL
nr:MAG TPA: hypothetical protein [Caudoviricetes sp.]